MSLIIRTFADMRKTLSLFTRPLCTLLVTLNLASLTKAAPLLDADSDEEVEKPSMDENVQELLCILGTKTSTLEARQLLFRAGGDIGRALNLHYDEPLPAGGVPHSKVAVSVVYHSASCQP